MFFHKNIRLAPQNYLGHQFYFVTLCCSARRRIFSRPAACRWLLGLLRSESSIRGFAIHAYCVMPDHLHFLAEGLLPSSNLTNFVKTFKIKTSRIYKKKTSQPLWQKKFFDHIVRPNEPVESVAWYIWMNPVRKGLSHAIGEYPFAGSFTQMSARMASSSHSWSPPWAAKAPASEGDRYNSKRRGDPPRLTS
jgi:putative transposase